MFVSYMYVCIYYGKICILKLCLLYVFVSWSSEIRSFSKAMQFIKKTWLYVPHLLYYYHHMWHDLNRFLFLSFRQYECQYAIRCDIASLSKFCDRILSYIFLKELRVPFEPFKTRLGPLKRMLVSEWFSQSVSKLKVDL